MNATDTAALKLILEPPFPFGAGATIGMGFATILAVVGVCIAVLFSDVEKWGRTAQRVALGMFLALVALLGIGWWNAMASSEESDNVRAEYEERLASTNACGQLTEAISAGRIRWLDANTFNSVKSTCGAVAVVEAANDVGVTFTVDNPNRRR